MTAVLEEKLAPGRHILGPLEEFVPRCIGPTWELDAFGRFVLPERTLGWHVIEWAFDHLNSPDGGEDDEDGEDSSGWMPTDEQARWILWYYAIDEHGLWLYRDAVLQRIKGWGKDPLAAMICAVELVGPCRFAGWEADGVTPRTKSQPRAWIQIVGTAQDQTKNTATLLQGIFKKATIAKFDIDVNKTIIYAHGATRRIEVTTSSYSTLEGNRPSLVIANETHHWKKSNDGHELWKVIRRNVNKGRKVRGARILSITNAFDPSQESVAQKQRRGWETQMERRGSSRVLYDSLEADETVGLYSLPYTDVVDGQMVLEVDAEGARVPPSEEGLREHLRRVLGRLNGDAWWLDVEETIDEIFDPESSPSEMRRFYLNSVLSGDDAYLLEAYVKRMVHPSVAEVRGKREHGDVLRMGWSIVAADDPVVLFFDGSKSDDSTAIVGCRLSDGYVFLVGIWEQPSGTRGRSWRAPRDQVDGRVHEAFARFNVVAFWGDPSHAKDDEDGTRYWDGLLDQWHVEFGDRLQYWAVQGGDHRSSTMWDMASPANQKLFSEAVVRFQEEVEDMAFLIDGHPALLAHFRHAREAMGQFGKVVRKPTRGGRQKIDILVCAVGARMLARLMTIKGLEVEEVPSREFWW